MTNDELLSQMTTATIKANQHYALSLPLDNQSDYEAAIKGRIAQLPDGGVAAPDGRTAWNIADYDFLQGECPDTVNPSLWRMAQLNAISGLFEITPDVWQARACDYANMTIVRGHSGWIVIDPLMTRETSAAVLKMVNDTLGDRPVSAIVVTHTHPDHFGGLKGVTGDHPDQYPPIYAPDHFMAYAASEGVLGGNHTSRRAVYQFGITLDTSATGVVDGGIGKSVARGSRTFVEPSRTIGETGKQVVIDGVPFVFQMASGTEAPAEFTFMLPDHNVLCMAEVCTQTMHNILPPRGAQVRDALLWSRTIDEAITLFATHTDILINCHNWPVWGKSGVLQYLQEQRDIYKYIHDQTLRLANHGHTPNEIAAQIPEPDWLSDKFHARGYYGSLAFNSRAVYQFYYGFFDGQPVNLDPLPPEQLAHHTVESLGGVQATINQAKDAIEQDLLQWAATLLNHVIFSAAANQIEDKNAVLLLAQVYRHQGYRSESGIMRNVYLTGAHELENGVTPLPMAGGRNEDLAATLSLKDWFDAYAVRLNPHRTTGVELMINFTVAGQIACVFVTRQTEFARIDYHHAEADLHVTAGQAILESLVGGKITVAQAQANGLQINAQPDLLQRWLDYHDTFDLWFNVVTP